MPRRTLADFELVLMLRGQATYIADRTRYDFPEGGIAIGRPGTQEEYHWDTTQTSRHAYFHFSIESMPQDWPPVSQWPRIIDSPPIPATDLFEHILIQIKEHPDWSVTAPNRYASSLLETLLDLCLQNQEHHLVDFESDIPEPMRRSIYWMRAHFENKPEASITLAKLAEAACVTENHLCRLFQKTLKVSPLQAVKLMRLQLSLSLLLRSNLSIQEIAFRCGFNDPLYFSRTFSKVYGNSPSRTRKAVLAGKRPPIIPDMPQFITHVYW